MITIIICIGPLFHLSSLLHLSALNSLLQARAWQYYPGNEDLKKIAKHSFSKNVETGTVSKIFSLLFGTGGLIMIALNYREKKQKNYPSSNSFYVMGASLLAQSGLFGLFAKYCRLVHKERSESNLVGETTFTAFVRRQMSFL